MRILRLLAFATVVGVVAAVALTLWQHSDSLFAPADGCTASVNKRTAAVATDQGENAALIAAIGMQRHLPARAVSIALATAFQESKIRNIPGGDADSLGIFQQRPSQGWGTPDEIMDPVYATNAFYNALEKIPDYQSLDITVAAQEVQRSAYPSAYAQHEDAARALASALTGNSAAAFTCVVSDDEETGTAAKVIAGLRRGFGSLVHPTKGLRQNLTVPVKSPIIGWSVAHYAVAMAPELHIKTVLFAGKTWHTGKDSAKGWTDDATASTAEVTLLME